MVKILNGDCREVLKKLPDNSIHCVVTSPPYFGLRSYSPDLVALRNDAPSWVVAELEQLKILPISIKQNLKD